jgi:hypothetical protein
LELGVVAEGEIVVNQNNWGHINDWKNDYDTALENILQTN